MASISQKIPNLLGGISQQSDPIKLPGQVVDAVNVLLDPTFGCKKRPPIKFIKDLGSGIPKSANWFPIFRDSSERYVACTYTKNNKGKLRVWNADTGIEQTVNATKGALQYINTSDQSNIHQLTIDDYTMIANGSSIVSMSDASTEDQPSEALIVINEVSYNTTYEVDFLKTEGNSQVKKYRATAITVSPGSFTVEDDDGVCSLADNDSFIVNGTGNKTGLNFNLITNCTPTAYSEVLPGLFYPTAVKYLPEDPRGANDLGGEFDLWATGILGNANDRNFGGVIEIERTVTTDAGDIVITFEVTVGGIQNENLELQKYELRDYVVSDYTINEDEDAASWEDITGFNIDTLDFELTDVQQGPDGEKNGFNSVYESKVRLNNGGLNWRIGDSVTVTMEGKEYTITVEDETFSMGFETEAVATYSTPSDSSETGAITVRDIVDGLASSITDIGTYDVQTVGNVIYFVRNDGNDFNLQTRGGVTNNAISGFKGEVADVSELPAQCIAGVLLKVRNTAEATADDYYVEFETVTGEIPGTGTWIETVKPGIPTNLNNATMPHVLIREADGSFTFRALSKAFSETLFWAPRAVGDEDTNPAPTFVDNTIADMFFHQNRLGFLSNENVILSQPGDYYNFFVGSAISVSDADPIDLTAAATKPSILKKALGTAKGVLLFSENSQFLMSSGEDVFAPSTVDINEISNYAYTSDLDPLESGVSIVFATEADTYSKVFEMALESIDNRPLVADDTRIIPELIPPNLTIGSSSPNNSFLCFGSGNNELFTFQYYNEGNNRSIAGWTRWTLPTDIKLFDFTHDTAFAVMFNKTSNTHTLGRLEFLDDPDTAPVSIFDRKFVPRLDNYLYDTEVTTSIIGDTTRVVLPKGSYVEGKSVYLMDSSRGNAIRFFEIMPTKSGNDWYFDFKTDLIPSTFIVGLRYQMLLELPSFYVKEENKADRRNIPIVENVFIDMNLSGSIEAILSRRGYEDRSFSIEQPIADVYLANQVAINKVITRTIPVYCRGESATVTLIGDGPLPVALSSYSWEGFYNNRGIQALA